MTSRMPLSYSFSVPNFVAYFVNPTTPSPKHIPVRLAFALRTLVRLCARIILGGFDGVKRSAEGRLCAVAGAGALRHQVVLQGRPFAHALRDRREDRSEPGGRPPVPDHPQRSRVRGQRRE